METFMTDRLTNRKSGFRRSGTVKIVPIRRSSDWLPENSDSSFMNTGAKIEYVVPRSQRSGQLIDPLGDLTDDEKAKVARELGLKDADSLNINKRGKENYWINRPVIIDRNGLVLNLSNIVDFINFKILEVNNEYIAPSWTERYNRGTYKFALVEEDEEAKLANLKIDTKKEAYILFGKIDGSVKKLSDFLWIYYLTNKQAQRPPNNPSLEYLKQAVGRIIEEKPGEFMSILSDPNFETKSLIQKSINIGLIHRDGQMFKIFGEDTSMNTLDGLINYLLDERNNNIRISLIGKIEAHETLGVRQKPTPEEKEAVKVEAKEDASKTADLEAMVKQLLEDNNALKAKLAQQEADSPKADPVSSVIPKRGPKKKSE